MNLEPQWIVGFVDGEGCFFVGLNKQPTMKTKIQVLPEFTVVQHKRDIAVLQNLKTYFQCGIVLKNHGDRYAYRVRGHENLYKKIIPFFEKHKLKTKKRVDFEKFRDVVLLMEKKAHLTFEGLEKITKIANTMNTKSHQGITLNTEVIQEILVETTRIEDDEDDYITKLCGTDSLE